MKVLPRHRWLRPSLALVCVGSLSAVLAVPNVAHADTTTTSVAANCTAFGQAVTITFPITTTIEPDAVIEGGTVRTTFGFSLPFVGAVTTLSSFDLTLAVPPQLQDPHVSFAGGNLTSTAELGDDGIALSMKGPRAATELALPTVVIEATVKPDTAGQTIVWPAPSALTTTLLAAGTQSALACVPQTPNTPLASTPIAPAPTTTTTTTTTVRPAGSGLLALIVQVVRFIVCVIFGWC